MSYNSFWLSHDYKLIMAYEIPKSITINQGSLRLTILFGRDSAGIKTAKLKGGRVMNLEHCSVDGLIDGRGLGLESKHVDMSATSVYERHSMT